MRTVAGVLVLTLLAGCATTADPNYVLQLQAYQESERSRQAVAAARATAEAARYNAIAQIAANAPANDQQTRTMAMFALAGLGERGAVVQETAQQVPKVPVTDADRALQWASVLVGPLSNVAFGYFGYQLGKTQSNNSANTSIASYGAMQGIADSGFKAVGQFKPVPIDWSTFPVTNQTTTTTTNTNNIDNRDGNVIVGTGQISQDNSPVVVVPPVVQIVPVVPK